MANEAKTPQDMTYMDGLKAALSNIPISFANPFQILAYGSPYPTYPMSFVAGLMTPGILIIGGLAYWLFSGRGK